MANDPRLAQVHEDMAQDCERIAHACGDPAFESQFLDLQQYHRNAARRIRELGRQAALAAPPPPWHEPLIPGALDE